MEKIKQKRSKTQEHTIKTADGRLVTLKLTRKLAMACLCSECLGWETNPADCTARYCPLYPFRVGTLRTKRGTMDMPKGAQLK